MTGFSEPNGFKIKAKFDLSKTDDGGFINPEAAKVYSLLKNMDADFQLSVGGHIKEYEMAENKEERYVNIKEFDAYEGSVVLRGAVEGATITNVFNEITENVEVNGIETFMAKANDEEAINELKGKFAEFKEEYDNSSEEFKTEVKEKFESINNVLLTLKEDYHKENKEEFGEMEQIYSIFTECNQWGKGVKREVDGDEDFKLSEVTQKELKFAATTAISDAIKPTYVTRILERLQAANPILGQIDFMSIRDNSLKISREELGLPSAGIVGETGDRTETTEVTLDNVTIELYQFYVMPVVSNKLLATNYVGYLPFLLRRTEYALALLIANKIFAGTGTNEPLGILNDTAVTNTIDFDISADGAEKTDANFAKKIKDVYYSVRSEIAENAVFVMRRATWAYITKLQNTEKAFYTTDFTAVTPRTLMNRPVLIVEDDNSGIKDIGGSDADVIMVFGDFRNGMQGIQNNAMTIGIEDRITTKGFTKYYMEKGLGFKVKLPENFVIITNTVV